ncbi:hypothetical protein GCM10023311_21970 [Flaviramulus aquimarinus]|uniref:Uncharacterized protein n=1 Tax=Flaviramulus aquimarinus TaxID=1170456 RepID=A0ABP9F8Q7_9FLAO
MKTSTFFKQAILYIFLGFMSLTLSAQTTHIVNNNAGASTDFTSLQAAIDAATGGDIIYVQHSPTTYGAITVNKAITIIGRSRGDNGYISTVGTITLTTGASNVTLKGLKISSISDNSASNGSNLTDLSIFDCDFTSSMSIGFYANIDNILMQGNIFRSTFRLYGKTSNILVTNNLFLGSTNQFYTTDTLLFSNNVVAAAGSGADLTNSSTSGLLNISNSIFVINSSANRQIDLNVGSGTIQVDNCISYNYNTTYTYNFETGTGITINGNVQSNINPLFTNIDNTVSQSVAGTSSGYDPGIDDLTLQGGSTVTDDGLHEAYNFKPFGTPTGYPSLKVTTYSPTVPKNGNLSVTIEAKTN